jgi:hypothetical protein
VKLENLIKLLRLRVDSEHIITTSRWWKNIFLLYYFIGTFRTRYKFVHKTAMFQRRDNYEGGLPRECTMLRCFTCLEAGLSHLISAHRVAAATTFRPSAPTSLHIISLTKKDVSSFVMRGHQPTRWRQATRPGKPMACLWTPP